MTLALLFLAACGICGALHVSTMALVGWLAGATVEEVSIWTGATVIRFRYRGVMYRLGVLPLGGHARFKDRVDGEKSGNMDEILFAPGKAGPAFSDLHPLKRIVITASGCAALIALGAFCLGPIPSVRSLGRGFLQLIPFAPWTPSWVPGGKELASRCVSLFQQGPFRVALGVMAGKSAAANLLPVPPLNGGMIVMFLVGWRKGLPDKVSKTVWYIGLTIILILMGYWVVQFLRYLEFF